MTRPFLVVMTGVPGTGKSAVADALGHALGAPVYAVDQLEAALNRVDITREHDSSRAAYELCATLAEAQLLAGRPAIVDAMHAERAQRDRLRELGARLGVPVAVIATRCSDRALHRERLDARQRELVDGFLYDATWAKVEPRLGGYADPEDADLLLDAVDPLDDNVARALALVSDRVG